MLYESGNKMSSIDNDTCLPRETAETQVQSENEGFLSEDSRFATKAIHSGYKPGAYGSWAIIPPICMSTTFKQTGPAEPVLYEYSRSNNPTRETLELCLASLDDGKYGLCFASGLGALSAVVQMLKAGDHLLSMDDVYGGTNRYFRKVATKFNISVTFYDFSDLDNLDKEIKPNTRIIWLENPTNPLLKVIDIKAVCEIVKQKKKDILVIVDNTFLTPFFQKPLKLGADVVIYSLTKYMNGHSDVVMGAAVLNDDETYEELKFLQNSAGIIPSPFDCYLVNRSLKTLKLRMKEHMITGLKVARFLESHPAVERVLHPGLKSHPGYDIAKRQWSGCSGMLSFYIKGGIEKSKLFLKTLKFFQTAESLGGYESLAEIPSIMTHASVPSDVREQLQITDNLIRLSVGLEEAEDLISDLNEALTAILAL